MSNYKYLICVQAQSLEDNEKGGNNNNKFYEMKDNGDGTFTATYGRIGNNPATKIYPDNKWESVYKQKINKIRNGYIYKDITHLKSEKKGGGFKDISDSKISALLNVLQSYSKKSILANYTVEASGVTQAMVDEAQTIIDDLSKRMSKNQIIITSASDLSSVNDNLIELYQIIPRKMKKVVDHLVTTNHDRKYIQELLSNEQNTLDVMAQQVKMNVSSDGEEKTIEDTLGIKIEHIDDNDHSVILDEMGSEANRFKSAFKVVDITTQPKYDNFIKSEAVKHWSKLLWHGSRNENWLNILQTGLLIRPSGAVLTGSMIGSGIYMADKCKKSLNYTSLRGSYWANGSENQGFLALFQVNTGMELRVNVHESWMYQMNFKMLKLKGNYDSVFFKGGVNLINNEYVVYHPNQCTIKYLIEVY